MHQSWKNWVKGLVTDRIVSPISNQHSTIQRVAVGFIASKSSQNRRSGRESDSILKHHQVSILQVDNTDWIRRDGTGQHLLSKSFLKKLLLPISIYWSITKARISQSLYSPSSGLFNHVFYIYIFLYLASALNNLKNLFTLLG